MSIPTVVPMIHVPDVQATINWYVSIGFKMIHLNDEDSEVNWAKLSLGNSEVMFSAGGNALDKKRREVDLYITTDRVNELF